MASLGLELSCKTSASKLEGVDASSFPAGSRLFHTPAEGRIYLYNYFDPGPNGEKGSTLEAAKAYLQSSMISDRPNPGREVHPSKKQYGLGLYTAADPFSSTGYGPRLLIIPLRPGTDILRMDVRGADASGSVRALKAINSAAGIISFPWSGSFVDPPGANQSSGVNFSEAFVLRNVDDVLWDEVQMFTSEPPVTDRSDRRPGTFRQQSGLNAALTEMLAVNKSELADTIKDLFLNKAWRPIEATPLNVLGVGFNHYSNAILKCCGGGYDQGESYYYYPLPESIKAYFTAADQAAAGQQQPPADAVAIALKLALISPSDSVATQAEFASAIYQTLQAKQPDLVTALASQFALINEIMTRVNEHAATALLEGAASHAEKKAGGGDAAKAIRSGVKDDPNQARSGAGDSAGPHGGDAVPAERSGGR